MTSSKKAVSLLTAAALIVAPVGGVAATYDVSYAGDDDSKKQDADEVPVPESVEQALEWIEDGTITSEASLSQARLDGILDDTQFDELCKILTEQLAANEKAAKEAAEKKAAEEAAAKEAAEKKAAAHAKAEAAAAAADKAQKTEADKTDSAEEEKAPAASTVKQEVVSADQDGAAADKSPASDQNAAADDEAAGDASEPADPTEPAQPADPAEPTTPVEPAEPADPAEPVQPVEPAEPVEPVEPAEPVDPVEPSEPSEPSEPAEPSEPVEPSEPTEPSQPSKPDVPEDTSDPVQDGVQKPSASGASAITATTHATAVAKGKAQTPLKQVAAKVPSISFTHMDNSAYVARHYSEDLTTEKFIALIGESARTIAAENDLYASVMIAQAILESASGNSTLSQAPNNNLFGIKGVYNGNSVQLPTREDDGSGSTYSIMSDFRQYANVNESLADYADLLSNSMGDFYAGAHKSNTESFVDAADFLVGRYATDIFYSEKLQDLIETYDLTRFDVPLTYESMDVLVLPVIDEETQKEVFLDPVKDKEDYDALVAEYQEYLNGSTEYQEALADWEEQTRLAEKMYNVPVYLEKPEAPVADTAVEQRQNEVDALRFEGFDTLIEQGAPLPVREERTLNDLTTLATSFLGVPYLWGGTTPAGFDCSGLVQYCYREVFNIELPRTTYYQCDVGIEVSFQELLPGDLLFFGSNDNVHHVAMYLGDGYYVEAPHTGDVVKITAMNDKLPDFAKRIVDVRDIDLSEFSDEQLMQFVDREKYLQEREQRLGVTDETLAELTEWLKSLEF